MKKLLPVIFLLVIAAFAAVAVYGITHDEPLEAAYVISYDYLLSEGTTVIENDLFTIEIDDGVQYMANLEDILADFFDLVEQTTELQFYPKDYTPERNGIRLFFGDVSDNEYGFVGSYANFVGVFINITTDDNELLSAPDFAFETILHEMVHCIQHRNGYVPSSMFAEGHAEHTARYIYKNYNPQFVSPDFFSYSIKGEMEEEIFSYRFEEYFCEEEYIYDSSGGSGMHSGGNIFGVYLNEEYGINEYSRLLKGFYETEPSLQHLNVEELWASFSDEALLSSYKERFIAYIKQETSNTVFIDFVLWYWAEYRARNT